MNTHTPTTNRDGAVQRTPDGKFAKGNTVAGGNPHMHKVATWRSALAETITRDDVIEVVAELVKQAKGGEGWAIRELLDRTVGPTNKIDLNVGDNASFKIVVLPAETAERTSKPLVTTDDTPPRIDVSPAIGEACDVIEAMDSTPAGATGPRIGHQTGLDRAEDGGDDER